MPHELKVPEVGESVQEVEIGRWLIEEGQWADKDQDVVEIETDKASLELPAPVAGVITKIVKQRGEPAEVGDVIAYLEERERPEEADEADKAGKAKEAEVKRDHEEDDDKEPEPADRDGGDARRERSTPRVMPAARRLLAEHDLDAEQVEATGPGGRLLKGDVIRYVEAHEGDHDGEPSTAMAPSPRPPSAEREEEVVPMSLIRRRIAQRLVEAQQTAALLTTINEIDMTAVIALRRQYGEAFREKYGVKLGFMSFFVKASIEALKQYPAVNAETREDTILYRNYFDIGFAVGGGKGLVVPVLRDAQRMRFAEIEQTIHDMARRAGENEITPEELAGGTFTITNGGVYGSLLSTPIVNPPQSGILGLHAINDRPVARDGQVVIRPMMYVALTYDHRIVDGREAVGFLVRIKEIVEDPPRMLLEV